MTTLLDSANTRIVAAYRKLGNNWPKQLIKNAASFVIHRLSHRVEVVVFDGLEMRLYRNRMITPQQLVQDIGGYNLHYHLQHGSIVIDVGAYTGIYTIYAALQIGPKGRVIAFEPDPYNRMMLKRNIRLNGLGNVICSNKGLYNREAVLAFDVQGFGSHVVEGDNARKSVNRIRVTTLDAELARLRIPRVDFVKMDVEGSELEALQGCIRTIEGATAIEFAVASYHVIGGRESASAVESFFRAHGLETFSGYPKHLTTFGYKR